MVHGTKLHKVYIIQGNYGQGWEDDNEETTLKGARQALKEDRELMPRHSHRIVLSMARIIRK